MPGCAEARNCARTGTIAEVGTGARDLEMVHMRVCIACSVLLDLLCLFTGIREGFVKARA